jgi:urease accessory protein
LQVADVRTAGASADLLVWQIVDSAFPTGGFSHSWGLESVWQHGELAHPEALALFVGDAVRQAGRSALPFVSAAHRDPSALEHLDEVSNAFLTNAVANRASRAQGRTFVASAARIWPDVRLAQLEHRARSLAAHVAPLTGAVLRILGVPLASAQRVVLFTTARGVLSAAVRLGAVGSYEAQRLQVASSAEIDATIEQCGDLGLEGLAQSAPLIDVLHAAHDRLYSRLFQS